MDYSLIKCYTVTVNAVILEGTVNVDFPRVLFWLYLTKSDIIMTSVCVVETLPV